MEGKRPKGKPRRKMLDLLMEQQEKKISYEELKKRAQSRVGWRHHHWNLPQGRARKEEEEQLSQDLCTNKKCYFGMAKFGKIQDFLQNF